MSKQRIPLRSHASLPFEDHPGVTWWNGLSREERARWLKIANTAIPAEAYKAWRTLMVGIHGRDSV